MIERRRPAGPMRPLALLVVGFLVVHVGVGLLDVLPWRQDAAVQPAGDVTGIYRYWVESWRVTGALVGIDTGWVYPIGALPPILLSGSVGDDWDLIVWLAMVAVLDAVALVLVARRSRSLAWWWLAFTALLGPVALVRIDAVALPIAIAGVLLVADRPAVAAVLLTVAAWVKVWPAAIVAAMLLAGRRVAAVVTAAMLTCATVIALALLAGARGTVFSFVTAQATRGIQVEAPIALPWLWSAAFGDPGVVVYYDTDILTFQLRGAGVQAVAELMTPVLVLGALAVVLLALLARRHGAAPLDVLAVAALGFVSVAIALNKVGSPQYLTWYVAPVLLGFLTLGARFRLPGALVLAAAGLTQLIYPWWYDGVTSPQPLVIAVLTVRNGIELVLLGWCLVALRTLPASPAPVQEVAARSAVGTPPRLIPMGPDVRGRASADPVPHSRAVVVLAVSALALGGFAIGSTEFVALGLLPDIARDLLPQAWSRSSTEAVAQAGVLVSAYAAGVVVGAPTIAAFGARLPRKTLLLALLIAFVVATVATAVLPGFGLVVAARFVAGLPHGAYFGVATLAAADLLGPGARGRSAAFVLLGLTSANVVGVPAITAVGQAAGWRAAYLVVAAAFALTFVAVLIAVPRGPGNPAATVASELRAFARGQVWLAVALGAIGFGGLFAAYTYIAPITTDVTGLAAGLVPVVLIVFGVGMTIGNLAGGWFVDRGVRRAVLVCFAGVLLSLLVLLAGARSAAGLLVGVLLIGVFSAALSPAIQVRLMDVAKGSTTIAAAATHSALNIGNALGAALGAVAIAAGLGYLSPIVVGVGMTAVGLVIAAIAFAAEHRAVRTDLVRPAA